MHTHGPARSVMHRCEIFEEFYLECPSSETDAPTVASFYSIHVSPTASPPASAEPAAPLPADAALDRWFQQEVRPHEQKLKSYLRGSFPAMRDVDDVVQESYLRIWRRQLRAPVQSAKNFLFRIAGNLAVDLLRREHHGLYEPITEQTVQSVMDERVNGSDSACSNQEIDVLLEAIERLPARCREVVILRKLHGLSQREIAERLGITENTVQNQAMKGLQHCRRFLLERGIVRSHRR